MEYSFIGQSGLRVSAICLGTMTFGSATTKQEAFKILDTAYERGVNFFDTAELYPILPDSRLVGKTEQIVGQWLKTKPRDSVILATKVAGASSGWYVPPVRHGLTAIDRFHIQKGIEGSLKRLKTDYIDLYQVHWPDSVVPYEEGLEALDRLVREGKVRYMGTSNESAYGLTKALYLSKMHGLKRFESIQNSFSLLNPRFLDELVAVCKGESVSLLPYSPLAGGILTGKYNQTPYPPKARYARYLNAEATHDLTQKAIRNRAKKYLNAQTLEATKAYMQIAQHFSIDPITMAIAWTLSFDFVPSSIVGATHASQLEPLLRAGDLRLSKEILKAIKEVRARHSYPMG